MDRMNRTPLGHEGPGQDAAGADVTSDAGDGGIDDGKRRRSRDSLLLIAQLQVAGVPGLHDVRVRNLSEGGLMIEFERALATDTMVTLEIRGIGEVGGRVAWCTEGRLGIALDTPIDPKKARKPVGAGTTTPSYAKAIVFREPKPRS